MRRLAPVDPEQEIGELKAYLGEAYDPRRLERWQETVNEELARIGDEQRLYRESQAYLYNLTAFAISATKDPYLDLIAEHVPSGAALLDYGCGIGSDGLRLIEAGYRVAFADFANPSVEYLRWRLARRGLKAQIFDLDHDTPAGFALAYAFDVIEHVDDPFALLARMEGAADRVLVNFLGNDPAEHEPHHRELPIGRLVRRAMGRELLSYRVHHGRSHVVLYGTTRGHGAGRLRSATVAARGARRGDAPAILLPIPWGFRPWRAISKWKSAS